MRIESRRILVSGVVQGVGFRPFAYRIAHEHSIAGSVRNLGDAGVEIVVEGSSQAIQAFLTALDSQAPPLSRIDGIEVSWSEPTGTAKFAILPSIQDGASGGQLPPDVATCEACVSEILGSSRFHGYWATSCTDCGPRFTVIESLPYDRPRTSMSEFPMCAVCFREYTDPLDRRYHAQTTACDDCGPVLHFDGCATEALSRATQALSTGEIVAIKGIGGTHIACDATNESAVDKLRTRLGRSSQPFALMATERMLSDFIEVSADELEMLRKPHRPILVLGKKAGKLLPAIAPGLHTIGVMLPYSGLHHLLFEALAGPLVMTSANVPGQPMLIENDEIVSRLEGIADHYLLHDRHIVARCDDSVQRKVAGDFVFLRRSRGFVPQALGRALGNDPILALGAESDLTFALYDREQITLSQHIGNVDDLETFAFLREAVEHLRRITRGRNPAIIACDAHPRFLTTQWAGELAEDTGTQVVRVQHHAAHLVSAMVENNLEESVGIILDGYGYGMDGGAWGGEIFAVKDRLISRVGSLRSVRLPGGDLAARNPLRMASSLLHAAGEDLTGIRGKIIKRGIDETEADLLMRQIESGINAPLTTSAGRFLDAVSAWLGVCRIRTYEGEPAMCLEAAAIQGRVHAISTRLVYEAGVPRLDTADLFAQLASLAERASIHDVAATAQEALAQGVATLGMMIAEERCVSSISLSGGVAYNDHIVSTIREIIKSNGYQFFTNYLVPCGDGGVSLGQAAYAGLGYRLVDASTGASEQDN